MAFTDVEMAILSQCAYLKNFPDDVAQKSLHSFLTENKDKLSEELGKGYDNALDGLLKKTKDQPYKIVQSTDDADGTGFAAFAIADPNNEVTVACRGTEGFNPLSKDSRKDMLADVQLTYSLQTNQQKQMEAFVQRLEGKGYDGYYFTGHSLGGNLAMYGSIALSDPAKLKHTATYNAPGFNAAFWEENRDRINAVSGRMTTFQNEMDAVSDCFISPGNIVILEDAGLDVNYDGVSSHFLSELQISGDEKTFDRNENGVKKPTLVGLGAFGLTTLTDGGMILPSPLISGGKKVVSFVSSAFEKDVRVPIGLLREYADQMQTFAETNASVFDRLTNSLLCMKGSGEWQGASLEAIVEATEKNKTKFEDTIDELQALATFLDKFVTEITQKDEDIKKQINSVG